MRNSLIVVSMFAIVSVSQAADHPQKPGQWRITIETEISGMPVKMPPLVYERCITAEEAKDPEHAVPHDPKDPCGAKDTKVKGNEVSWSIDCPKKKVSGKGHIVFSDESYSGEMKMNVGDQKVVQRHSGKWLGECTK